MEYIKKIVDNGKKEDMERLGTMMYELMNEIKDCNKAKYDTIKSEMYEMAYGKMLNEEKAIEWVKNMKPYGEHWNIEQTTKVLQDNSIAVDPVNFYAVMNMMYNDYCETIGDNDTMYVKLTMNWLNDTDAKENKLYEYWKNVIKR